MTAPVVLVHGAWHGAWCWDLVVDELASLGRAAVAVELPLTGLGDDVEAARRAVTDAGEGAVVVGHSYGGLVISLAASGASTPARLVYLAALMLDTGDDVAQVMGEAQSDLLSALVPVDGGVRVDPERAADLFYGDLDPAAAALAVSKLRTQGAGDGFDMSARPAWKDTPSTYVVCTADRALPVEAQRTMAQQATDIVEWPTDHSPFLSRPAEVARLLASYVSSPRGPTTCSGTGTGR